SGFHSSSGVAVDVAVDAGAGMEDGASLGRHRHEECGKCCVGWVAAAHTANPIPAAVPPAAAPPAVAPLAAAPPAAAPPGWVRVDELRGWMPLDAEGNVLPAQPRPVAQPVPGWVQLDADGNVPPAQPR
ncbi:hypothetical protein ACLKA6_002094, partial [Drosophila palustris]